MSIRRKAFRLTVAATLVGGVAFYAISLPPVQLPHDPSKKTLAILGSGWAATSVLKDIDSHHYNIVVISPRNYFLFTPLLPSATTGTVELRSIMQPIRYITRYMAREVLFVEGECTAVDVAQKFLTVHDNSEVPANCGPQTIKYDHLIIACGAENATFGIKGVTDHACFLKESTDAKKIRTKMMDCLETASFPNLDPKEVDRLLHMVVVGGGPTGVEYAAELHDFLKEDLMIWYPALANKLRITLVEATSNVLPMFSKELIDYTQSHFREKDITILANTMVKKVEVDRLTVLNPEKKLEDIPYGLLVWATGNAPRKIVTDLIASLPKDLQNQRRGLVIDDTLRVSGTENIWALGDATATKWAPTAQVASGQGRYLAHYFNKLAKEPGTIPKPFAYEHLGTLAYVGSNRAIADLPGNVHVGGSLTYLFWRSAYLSNLFTNRNRVLVLFDWTKKTIFGRDISRE